MPVHPFPGHQPVLSDLTTSCCGEVRSPTRLTSKSRPRSSHHASRGLARDAERIDASAPSSSRHHRHPYADGRRTLRSRSLGAGVRAAGRCAAGQRACDHQRPPPARIRDDKTPSAPHAWGPSWPILAGAASLPPAWWSRRGSGLPVGPIGKVRAITIRRRCCDAQRALRLIRARAQEYRVDPAKVGVLGGSAGRHLAALMATLYDNTLLPDAPYVPDATDASSAKPSFVLLLYPVIDLSDDAVTHRGSRTNLTQDKPTLYDPCHPRSTSREIPRRCSWSTAPTTVWCR